MEITIQNLAIIESLRLEFGSGLNVLTGETGTGKSIIIDAVNLLLGARASSDLVRTGSDRAVVEGVFALSADEAVALHGVLQEYGLSDDGSELIIRREVSAEGRSVCRVNGRTVPSSYLTEITRHLVDIHGQGEHLSLMQVRRHIDFLDRYGRLGPQRDAFAVLAERLTDLRRELRRLVEGARDDARRKDLLAFQSGEIRVARLTPGEDELLQRERSLLANAEKRAALAAQVFALLSDGEGEQRSALDLLSDAMAGLSGLARLDDSLAETETQAEVAFETIEELARIVRNYRDEVEFDPHRLKEIEERLELIYRLKRKYGDTIEEVLAFADQAETELDAITHSAEGADALREEERTLLEAMGSAAESLSASRREVAQTLVGAIEKQLAELGMGQARFLVQIARDEQDSGVPLAGARYAFDGTGIDRVEFLIAPNPGEEPKPLVRIASGGETSRLMLAMKTALVDADPVSTLIFDEIDAGIGGHTGAVVGLKLHTLAARHQVFCVTHLAQIAAQGSRHYRVTKDVVGGRTLSTVRALAARDRVEELAIMLGGQSTEATRRSAEELLAHGAARLV